MARYRSISTAALAALALSAPVAVAHASSTLLSGYGGPGQGNQALIGSTLIGGGGNGAGGGAGSSEARSSSSPSSSSAPVVSIALAPKRPAPHRSHRSSGTRAATPSSDRSNSGVPAYTPAAASALHRSGGGALGLSTADVAYIVLAFALLALTALATARLAGRAGRAAERNSARGG